MLTFKLILLVCDVEVYIQVFEYFLQVSSPEDPIQNDERCCFALLSSSQNMAGKIREILREQPHSLDKHLCDLAISAKVRFKE